MSTNYEESISEDGDTASMEVVEEMVNDSQEEEHNYEHEAVSSPDVEDETEEYEPEEDDPEEDDLGEDDIEEDDIHEDGLSREDFYANWEETAIDGIMDMAKINFKDISRNEVKRLHFPDRGVAFLFYNWYARMNGFSGRKSKVRKNSKSEVVQQAFVCFRQGFRECRHSKSQNRRKREPKPETRCGCEAQMRVHVDIQTERWIVTFFSDCHNHEMLDDWLTAMLPAHRKMNEAEIEQMNNMLKVGIGPPQIYGSFVHMAGGYQNLNFVKRDMYNQIDKQRRMVGGDARSALKFLTDMANDDPAMFVRHEVDEDGRLLHLFWSDSSSQLDYELFGDVLAFDATYRKNKYLCPLVVFSGVNHHNQTIVFASALVSNEIEETYVWLLQQFLVAMKGKAPSCVITDGDLAMRNSIEKVFPQAQHRLCAWHLIRNATSNIGNPKFTARFKKCMLGDYEIGEFNSRWESMVTEFGVKDNNWVCEMYEKRNTWATAYIRGHFFAGFRTTSRCEGLHSMLGKFVHSRKNLTDFVEQFFRCLMQMRFREVQADLASVIGDPVVQTPFESLERSAGFVFSREIFHLFRPMLSRACTLKVVGWKETPTSVIYTVVKYCKAVKEWHVSYYQNSVVFKCSCLRMESLGIPCDHIVAVLVHLDIAELPKSLILERWTKNARSRVQALMEKGPFCWDSMVMCRNWILNDICRQLCNLASQNAEDFNDVREKVRNEISSLLGNKARNIEIENGEQQSSTQSVLRDPARVRSKGCGAKVSGNGRRGKRITRCSVCRSEGHNRVSCPVQAHIRRMSHGISHGGSAAAELDDELNLYNAELSAYGMSGQGYTEMQLQIGTQMENEQYGQFSYPYYSLRED